jgi:exopolyphosphatase / guanosine-5'-triphosphate,3'-diphosphate pyrophosphatase
MGTRRLVIDIGTNSVLALLSDVTGDRLSVISDRKQTTRLGEGLSATGNLSPIAMRRTVEAVIGFAKSADYDELFMVGTEALRLARNSHEFSEMIKSAISREPMIISGLKEAELSFLGARYNLNVKLDNVLLIDVGGGSTELVLARGEALLRAISIPVGALKLKENTSQIGLDTYMTKAREIVLKAITDFNVDSEAAILATGGTITSVAAIKTGLDRFNSTMVHGSLLLKGEMRDIASRFENTDAAGRTLLIPFDPERAELILPGLGIFLAIMGITDKRSLVVSAGGLRFGVALYPDKLLP